METKKHPAGKSSGAVMEDNCQPQRKAVRAEKQYQRTSEMALTTYPILCELSAATQIRPVSTA